jgi:hypothetical protein
MVFVGKKGLRCSQCDFERPYDHRDVLTPRSKPNKVR